MAADALHLLMGTVTRKELDARHGPRITGCQANGEVKRQPGLLGEKGTYQEVDDGQAKRFG